ncbi:MAG: 18 kDa heat shock protein [Candidatus Dojkabacteria bacterium]|nr:MAG: 18 kDa heat shock protein [Candidatus Dojkabacteria bacterium]
MKVTRRNNPTVRKDYFPITLKSIFDELTNPFFDVLGDLEISNIDTSADVWEEGDSYFIKMALPGIKKDKINVEIDADVVRITAGEKNEEKKEEKGRKYFYRSMSSYFEQTFNLPTPVDSEKAEASFKDGVLEIKLPKAESYKPKKLSIH